MGDSVTLSERVLGAYLGLAVGDALGATVEFLTPREIQLAHGVHRDICGGGWLRLKPGQVTDDTEMSLALGDAILARRGVEATCVAEAFSQWMRGKPVDIGNTVRRGIVHYRTRGETCVPKNEHDAGNGACMRCLPVAIAYAFSPEAELLEASRIQSHVTHNAPVADAGTETVLRMLVNGLRGASAGDLAGEAERLVACHAEYGYDGRRVENPSGWIVDTLKVVFQSLFANSDFEAILVDVVNRGGDADTTAAIAGMLAGACFGVRAIPQRWLAALAPEVRRSCEHQALALLRLAEERAQA